MRLRTFRVQGFRCIRDSGSVSVRDLAVLIGKNETGKTAILEALSHLNRDTPFRPVDLCDEMYAELEKGVRVVEGEFELTEPEIATLKENVDNCPDVRRIVIFRMNNPDEVQYEFPDVKEFPIRDAIVDKTVNEFTGALEKLRDAIQKVSAAAQQSGTTLDLTEVEDTIGKLENFREMNRQQLNERIVRLSAAIEPVATDHQELEGFTKKLVQIGAKLFSQQSLRGAVEALIASKFHPRFVYFSDYKKLHGRIHLPTYIGTSEEKQLEERDLDVKETVDNLFYLASLDAKYLHKIRAWPDERMKYLAECGSRLTKALDPTWLTQKIEVEFEYAEKLLVVKISDLHEDGTRTNKGPLRRRSEGFKWHFSFFVNFTAAVQQTELREAILLLDEPGLHLHPAQQHGMLSILRQLATNNQALYSTHSPFMILDYDVGSVLSVELDRNTHLSHIETLYWKGEPETALLILHALGGHAISEPWAKSLAEVEPPALIVEGPTDYMYLKVMLEVVRRRRDKSEIDIPFGGQFVPSNGSSAIAPLAMFHLEKGFKVAVLYDNEPQARKYSEGLVAQGFDQTKVFFAEVDGKTESDIEDFFSEQEYLWAVNNVYTDVLRAARFVPITKTDLKTARERSPGTTRIAPLLVRIWEENPSWGTFDKATVCRRICDRAISDKAFLVEKTIERFENLFKNVHGRLTPEEKAPSPEPVAQPAEVPRTEPKPKKRKT